MGKKYQQEKRTSNMANSRRKAVRFPLLLRTANCVEVAVCPLTAVLVLNASQTPMLVACCRLRCTFEEPA